MRAHCATLKPDEITSLSGIPVTSASRTMLDFAAMSTERQLVKALNELEVRGITDELSIPDLLERYPRKRGSAKLRSILGEETAVRGIVRRELEQRFSVLLEGTDLARPRLNADVAVRGRFFEVDCLLG